MPYTARFVPETQSRADVDASRGPLLLEFGTDWCGHCQAAQPGIEAAFADAGAGVRSVRTYQDLLRNETDGRTLEHYLTS